MVNNARLQEQRDYAEDRRKEAVANFKKARNAVDLMLTRVGQESLAHVPHTGTMLAAGSDSTGGVILARGRLPH